MSVALRILALRGAPADFERLGRGHLVFGFVATWLVGMGRYWDNPRALPLQKLGVGSLVYVVALSALLFVIGYGLRPPQWSYRNLLTFVTLTAVPGFVYAIPVERWLAPSEAQTANLWFLGIVATWRVALYGTYLRRFAGLDWTAFFVTWLLPLVGIVMALAMLNLEHAVFDVMGGLRETTPADSAYGFVFLMAVVAFFAAPVLITVYCILASRAWRRGPSGPRDAGREG